MIFGATLADIDNLRWIGCTGISLGGWIEPYPNSAGWETLDRCDGLNVSE